MTRNLKYVGGKYETCELVAKFITDQFETLVVVSNRKLNNKYLQLLFCFIDIKEADDMGMVDELHDCNFSLDSAVHSSTVDQGRLGDDFDGHLLVGLAMASEFDTSC